MKKEVINSEIQVNDNKIKVITLDNKEFISLTDLARYANPEKPKIPIQTWMRNKDVIAYLGLWEKLNNENFKGNEFTTFENTAGKNSFYMSPQRWIRETNAIGIISKSGNNGGTFARSDIALEFASWLSPEFKLYVIQGKGYTQTRSRYYRRFYEVFSKCPTLSDECVSCMAYS